MPRPVPGARSHASGDTEPVGLSRRHLIGAAVATVGTIGWWGVSRSGASGNEATPTSSVGGPASSANDFTAAPDTSAAPTPPTEPVATEPEIVEPAVQPLERVLVEGLVGDDVRAVQQRLADLPFDPGPVDGIFGGMTLRAVWAYEKLVIGTARQEMRGAIDDAMWQRMNEPHGVAPRRTPGGTHLEVYLPEQVAVLFENGAASVISHVSTGENITWCDEVEVDNEDGTTELQGICGVSKTPGGVYSFNRKVEGWRNAKLGRLFKPVYFNFGIAIHGATSVPAEPKSRGCVRYPMHIADYIQDMVSLGDMVYVFDGVEEPETYGAQPMIFDYPDPDWIPPETTTTVPESTTTVPETTTTTPPTTAPATTVAPTTTAPSTTTAPTTTVAPPTPASSTTTSTVAPGA